MAKLGRLRDKKTGETIYPATITDGVVNPVNRRKLTEELQLLSQNKANKTEVVSNTKFTTEMAKKQEKLVSGTNIKTLNGSSLLGEGDIKVEADSEVEVTHGTQPSGANTEVYVDLDGSAEGVMVVPEAPKDGKEYVRKDGAWYENKEPKGGYNRALYEAAGAVYHEDTNTWSYEYGGGKIENLTTQDVINSLDARTSIFEERCYSIPKNPIKFNFVQSNIEAIISWGYNIPLNEAFRQNTSIKIAFLGSIRVGASMLAAFNYDLQLEEVVGRLDVSATTTFNIAFDNCPKFKKIQLLNLKANVSFKDSPLLYVAKDGVTGLGYMIKNAQKSATFTITLAKVLETSLDVAYWRQYIIDNGYNITIAFA